jgi:hypothetical protein
MPVANTKSALAHYYAGLGEHLLERERRIKQEIAVVAFLWLAGCPALCLLLRSFSAGCEGGEASSLYGAPDEVGICGLYSYSVSSSMTGTYPKILGSVLAPLFALLVVQRTSSGLCSNLKLGLMVRFSLPLSTTTVSKSRYASTGGKQEQEQQDEEATAPYLLLVAKLWKRIERIEQLGYVAAIFLVALVAFDSRDFVILHCFLASAAFFALYQQNWLVGTLGIDYGNDLFPDWSYEHAKFIFYLGMFHLGIMYVGYFTFGFLHGLNKCTDLLSILESMSIRMFGNPTTMRWLASVAFWYNEYAFAVLCIYIQLLQHYDLRLWDFAGATNMPYMAIVSRFSIRAAVESVATRGSSDADVFLGVRKSNKVKVASEYIAL